MPVCSGLRLLEGLREAGWATPIILMTAFGDRESRATAERLGAVLLDKPFELDGLRRLVGRHQRRSTPSSTQPTSILLAEDDGEMRHFLSSELRADGYDVFCTCDGSETLEVLSDVHELRHASPDVIITDVRMPGYSGLHILTTLRAAHCSIPVIVITAFGDLRLHEEAARLGAAVVFDKPFDIDDLRTALLNLDRAHSK